MLFYDSNNNVFVFENFDIYNGCLFNSYKCDIKMEKDIINKF